MKKLKIAVGTKSGQKIGYLREVLGELGIEADIIPNDVGSGVSDQPITSEETKTGSINRAREALKKHSDPDFAIGIEIGYHKGEHGKYEMFCWATVIDNHGHIISQESHRFLLPKFYQELISNKLYLGDYVEKYSETVDTQSKKHLAELFNDRKSFITVAVKNALMIYLNKDEFK